MTQSTIRLPEEMLKRLHELAAIETLRTGRKRSWGYLVRRVITDHLLNQDSVPESQKATTNWKS